jgi:hypothetical protein
MYSCKAKTRKTGFEANGQGVMEEKAAKGFMITRKRKYLYRT